jgi:hypothetical protein
MQIFTKSFNEKVNSFFHSTDSNIFSCGLLNRISNVFKAKDSVPVDEVSYTSFTKKDLDSITIETDSKVINEGQGNKIKSIFLKVKLSFLALFK